MNDFEIVTSLVNKVINWDEYEGVVERDINFSELITLEDIMIEQEEDFDEFYFMAN